MVPAYILLVSKDTSKDLYNFDVSITCYKSLGPSMSLKVRFPEPRTLNVHQPIRTKYITSTPFGQSVHCNQFIISTFMGQLFGAFLVADHGPYLDIIL